MAKVIKIDAHGKQTITDENLGDYSQPPSKKILLDGITVTTQAGNTFDGNETARNNMMCAIMAADIIGQKESDWKLADNTVAHITLDELKEALALSIQRVGEIVLAG